MLAEAHRQATKSQASVNNGKYITHYHKCLFALIKVMNKRIKLFYKGNLQKHGDIEQHFQSVMAKILKKMEDIEYKAKLDMGEEKAFQMLLPFISIVKPILAIFGIDQDKILKNASSLSDKDDSIFRDKISPRKDETSNRERIMPEIKEYVAP